MLSQRILEEPCLASIRCLVPELPFGAHPVPMKPSADLTAAGLGRMVADFLGALDLCDVTLVGNDSGAAVAQVVAARHAGRLLQRTWGGSPAGGGRPRRSR